MIKEKDKAWLRRVFGGAVRFDESMGRHTYFRIGGPADAWVEPENEPQLGALLEWARHNAIPYLLVGGGTNLLVRDGGIRGLVIHLGRLSADVQWVQQGAAVMVSSGAGVPTKRICALALRHGWQGMNFALGIPGSLGGAIIMNAGTAQGCMADVVEGVTMMNTAGEKVELDRPSLNFDYRRLRLPEQPSGRAVSSAVLMTARLILKQGDREKIRRQARQLMQGRSKTQPAGQPSAGCFFKNPSKDQPAGRLIDQAGLKGFRVGDAQVSLRHANFIINCGKARAEDVLAVAARVRETVKDRFDIDLVPEVCIVGEEKTGAQKSF
jgi:UDP-N-acetylmuramate dehydrogenase